MYLKIKSENQTEQSSKKGFLKKWALRIGFLFLAIVLIIRVISWFLI